jgi:hypothetical protein
LSVDRRQWGSAWALAQLAAGVGGGLAMVKFAQSQPEEAETSSGRFAREAEPAVSESTAR